MHTVVDVRVTRYSASQLREAASKWLVGSSRRRSAGCERRARPSATRMRHPPERSWVFFLRKSCEKPRPIRISVARNSNVFGSIRSIRS
mmetsp:Transcript_20882/g.47100  ORF Transcript_20882/g.47100 Transcript_20882/m.47100 type:complete len:89 (+) Transcript_20882:1465-1731(+)